MSGYFQDFKRTFYANTVVTNIFSRIKIDDNVIGDASLYYAYEVSEGERPDTIANHYYEDPTLDWLVYYSNKIIDPYFEWPLSINEFNEFVAKKYAPTMSISQGIVEAERRILYYRVNWYADDSVLSPASYDALTAQQKKYWKPVFGQDNNPVGYERKEMDLVADTNKIVSLSCTTSGPFQEEERILQYNANNVLIAEGIVSYASPTNIIVKRIQGEFVANNMWTSGATSGETAHVTEVTTLKTSIPAIEFAYWTPVTAYMYEEELNGARKSIYLIDRKYVPTIEKQIRELLA